MVSPLTLFNLRRTGAAIVYNIHKFSPGSCLCTTRYTVT